MYRKHLPALGGLVFALVTVLLFDSCVAAQAQNRHKAADPWSALKGHALSSVAWSPKGDRIAFVAASYRDDADDGLLRASIWAASSPKQGHALRLKRVVSLTRKQGIPASLFWLDNNRIGWAASYYSERSHAFGFMQMSLSDGKPKRLTNQSFSGVQNRPSMESAFGGPDDVYYDAASHTLLFSGGVMPTGVYVKILPISAGKIRKLHVPGADDAGWVTLCGSIANPPKPKFYVAAVLQEAGEKIWFSNSYSLHESKVLVASSERYLQFPRISPDGRMLCYLSIFGKTGLSEIVLCDLVSGNRKTLVTFLSQWEAGVYPAMGCPFSWSPNGKQIAYADGSRIKIADIHSAPREKSK